jgi:PncC family amidohydrolase
MNLDDTAREVAAALAEKQKTLVLAESCTGGLISATLTRVPGVSSHLAGSMVVYQEASKMRWLGVAEETLQQFTAVSAAVAHQMATGVLRATPHADVAASVTGHLGPDAPEGFDGVVFVGLAHRGAATKTWRFDLTANRRVGRQQEAALVVLQTIHAQL